MPRAVVAPVALTEMKELLSRETEKQRLRSELLSEIRSVQAEIEAWNKRLRHAEELLRDWNLLARRISLEYLSEAELEEFCAKLAIPYHAIKLETKTREEYRKKLISILQEKAREKIRKIIHEYEQEARTARKKIQSLEEKLNLLRRALEEDTALAAYEAIYGAPLRVKKYTIIGTNTQHILSCLDAVCRRIDADMVIYDAEDRPNETYVVWHGVLLSVSGNRFTVGKCKITPEATQDGRTCAGGFYTLLEWSRPELGRRRFTVNRKYMESPRFCTPAEASVELKEQGRGTYYFYPYDVVVGRGLMSELMDWWPLVFATLPAKGACYLDEYARHALVLLIEFTGVRSPFER